MLSWKFTPSEFESFELKPLSNSGAYALAKKVRRLGIFNGVEIEPSDDGFSFVVVVRATNNGVPYRRAIKNLLHLKTLCKRNGIDLKQRIKNPSTTGAARGFKTVARFCKNEKKEDDLADLI